MDIGDEKPAAPSRTRSSWPLSRKSSTRPRVAITYSAVDPSADGPQSCLGPDQRSPVLSAFLSHQHCNRAPKFEAPARSRASRLPLLLQSDLPGIRLAMLFAQELNCDRRLHEMRDGLCPRRSWNAGSLCRISHDALPYARSSAFTACSPLRIEVRVVRQRDHGVLVPGKLRQERPLNAVSSRGRL